MTRSATSALALAAATIMAAVAAMPAAAQQTPAPCPALEREAGTPFELRIGDRVFRAQVRTSTPDSGARVDARLVGCEQERIIGSDDADAPTAPIAGGPLLRLLDELSLAFQVGPAEEGDCVRARLEVSSAGTDVGVGPGGRPVDLRLCGLSAIGLPATDPTASPPDGP